MQTAAGYPQPQTTLPYTPLQYSTLYYTKNTTPHYTTLYYTTLQYTALQYIKLQYTTPHHTTLHYTALHYSTLHSSTVHYTKPHCTTLLCITLHYTDYTTRHYTSRPYSRLKQMTSHYITMQYTTLHHITTEPQVWRTVVKTSQEQVEHDRCCMCPSSTWFLHGFPFEGAVWVFARDKASQKLANGAWTRYGGTQMTTLNGLWLIETHPKATSKLSRHGIQPKRDLWRISLTKTLFFKPADAPNYPYFASEEATSKLNAYL